MKKLFVFALAVVMFSALSGCSKKHDVEELEPITLESLGANTGAAYQAVPQDIPAPSSAVQAVAPAKDLVPLPPQGPYKPTDIEIQMTVPGQGLFKLFPIPFG